MEVSGRPCASGCRNVNRARYSSRGHLRVFRQFLPSLQNADLMAKFLQIDVLCCHRIQCQIDNKVVTQRLYCVVSPGGPELFTFLQQTSD